MTYLAIDLGEKRIGLALSDGLHMVASPYEVFPRRSRREDFAHVARVVAAEQVDRVVVGVPIRFSGEEGSMAAWARDYGADLGRTLGVPVVFWDETLTSEQAESAMRARGYNKKQMIGKLDAVAAALLLQSYLEAERERDDAAGPLSFPPPPSENRDRTD